MLITAAAASVHLRTRFYRLVEWLLHCMYQSAVTELQCKRLCAAAL
jgi:hypothetical protein